MFHAIQAGLVESCHDCSDGGLGVALAESAFAGAIGMKIDLANVPREGVNRDDYLLFSETPSRLLVTVCPPNQSTFEEIFAGTTFAQVGLTQGSSLIIKGITGEES